MTLSFNLIVLFRFWVDSLPLRQGAGIFLMTLCIKFKFLTPLYSASNSVRDSHQISLLILTKFNSFMTEAVII